MEKTAVTVKIFNDEYTLKTDLPRTDVDAIAAMVDKKCRTGDKPAFGHNFQSRCMGGVGSGGRVIYLTS